MDGKTVTLIGAAAALAGVPAMASPPAATPAIATSYAELLDPIPNAAERLKVADAQEDARPPQLIEAQYAAHHHHHHHHHNRQWYQQHGYYWAGGRWILRPPHHHHHHHHHHNNNY